MSRSPLARRIAAMIRLEGPMPVSRFMALALADPEHGYYMRREPFGAGGDFVTAPEVSQMFGELVGAWMLDMWERLGRPDPMTLVELGPGRGTLMADLLRTVALRPGFVAATRLMLVETSPRLRARQAERLAGSPLRPAWVDRIEDVPPGPLLVVANEFFDALPIRQYQRAGGVWRERVVGLSTDGEDRFVFGLGAGALVPGETKADLANAADGAIIELAPFARGVMTEIAQRIARDGGAALAIDYGHARSAIGDTLQAVGSHAYRDPLDNPGEIDITAHVDFEALAAAATAAGAHTHGPVAQGAFLIRLGLLERAGALGRGRSAEVQERLSADVTRLADEREMGTLFKVLAVTPAGVMPVGFD